MNRFLPLVLLVSVHGSLSSQQPRADVPELRFAGHTLVLHAMTPDAALAMHRDDPLGRWLTSPGAEDVWRVGREQLVEAFRQLGDSCYAFSLRDAAAFGASLEKMIRGAALHTGRKRTSYREHQIYTFDNPMVHSMVGMPVHYAVTDECVLVGFDEGGLIGLRGVLDEMDAVAQGEPHTPPQEIEDLVALLDDGYYAADHANLAEFAATMRYMLAFLREQFPEASPTTGAWNSAGGLTSDQNLAIVLDLLIGLLGADFNQAGFAARALYFREHGVVVRNIW